LEREGKQGSGRGSKRDRGPGGKQDPGRGSPDTAAPVNARLLWRANDLFSLVTQLRVTASVADLGRLRGQIATLLVAFLDDARASGIGASRAAQATEVMAALVDHVVNSMPWGADAGWMSLSQSTATGNRRPAQRLLTIAAATSSDPGMQELISVALLVGFDKRSRGEDNSQIEQLLARTALPARSRDADAGQSVSPSALARAQRKKAAPGWLPLWVSGLVIAASLAVLFVVLLLSLAAKSDAVYAHLAALPGPHAGASRPEPALTPRLTPFLAMPVAAQSMVVRDEIDRSVIVVPENRLFSPGESALIANSDELLRPIAAGLKQTPGRVRIIGHTDSKLARSARFSSDWDLSVERARAVQAALQTLGIEATRISYDGHASIEPLQAADPARAIGGDGRVEILLLVGR